MEETLKALFEQQEEKFEFRRHSQILRHTTHRRQIGTFSGPSDTEIWTIRLFSRRITINDPCIVYLYVQSVKSIHQYFRYFRKKLLISGVKCRDRSQMKGQIILHSTLRNIE